MSDILLILKFAMILTTNWKVLTLTFHYIVSNISKTADCVGFISHHGIEKYSFRIALLLRFLFMGIS